jgi:hypothetical protein
MRSIPAAMTWELLKRGRWGFLLTILTAIALPALVLMALRHDGTVNQDDPSMLIMQIVMLQVGMFSFGTALYGAHGKMSQLYTYPARTSELVASRLLPIMVIIALQVVIYIGVLNAIFGLQWPIWGPAIFAAVAMAAVLAVTWLTEKSVAWMALGLTLVCGVLGMWFRSRFGSTFSNPAHTWRELTSGETLTMLAMAAAAHGIAIKGVARNRRGDPPLSIGFFDWLDRTFRISPAEARLTTSFQAQCWHEWRRKGWAMPMSVLVLIIFGFIAWCFGSRSARDLFQAFFVGGHMMWGLGFIGGILMGNIGPTDSNYSMGHFAATRPMSDSDIARAVLRTAAQCVLLTWSIWLVAFLIVCVCLLACGASEAIKPPPDWSWWCFPATLLGPWIVMGALMSLLLVGRENNLVRLACAIPAVIITGAVISKFLLTRDMQWILNFTMLLTTTIGLVSGCIWAFVAAYRRRLIQRGTVWAAALVWMALVAGLCLKWPQIANLYWPVYLLIAAAASLVVAPIATVPLAISWNRHR